MKFHTEAGGPARGSILILVMWVLMLLSIFTLSVGYSARQRLRLLDRLEAREKLRGIAEAGVQTAVQAIRQEDLKAQKVDALNETWSRNDKGFNNMEVGNGYFSCTVVDEERKINLNQTNSTLILTRLFEYTAGLDEQAASDLAAAILDWRDEDNDVYESGAESRYYQALKPPYTAKNAALNTLEELLLVRGMTPAILEKIRAFVTLSGNSLVNLNTAPREVLLSLGFSEVLVKAVMAFRSGRDQEAGTSDDGVFADLSLAGQTLEASGYGGQNERSELENLIQSGKLDIHSEHFTIESRARLVNSSESLTVRCLTKRNVGITGWAEEYAVLPAESGAGK